MPRPARQLDFGWDAERPGDLIEMIHQQAADEISWKIPTETMRRLEDEGYVEHREFHGCRT
jgi:hypothetical protein